VCQQAQKRPQRETQKHRLKVVCYSTGRQRSVWSGMEDALEFSVGPWQNLSESFSWGEATAALPSQVLARDASVFSACRGL
jgi:hypothetical protein